MPAETELMTPEQTDALSRFLSWQALASELICVVVARGVPQAPTREQRRALLHQVRTEQSQGDWSVKRVAELGREVPERDPALDALREELVALCDQSWLDFLACGQIALRAYMAPFLRALPAVFAFDDEYEGFTRDVLVPEVRGHLGRAVSSLTAALAQADDPKAALERAQEVESRAYAVFQQFIGAAFPPLEALGAETASIPAEMAEERARFWAAVTETTGRNRPSDAVLP